MKETPIFEEVFMRVLKLPGFWTKLLVGGLLSFVPIVNLFAFGYLLRLSQSVRTSASVALPEWEDWQGLFIDGLKFAVVWLGYWLLPVLLAMAISGVIGLVGLGALSYLLVSLVFLSSTIVFTAALYRYNMRSDFKDLLDVALIVRMGYAEFSRLILPALASVGVIAIAAPLYGFAVFFAFVVLVIYSTLSFLSIEKGRPSRL